MSLTIDQPLPQEPVAQTMRLSRLERQLLWLGIGLRFCVSNDLLNLLYPYTSVGGSPALKIHPGTYILLFTFVLVIWRLGIVRVAINQAQKNFGTFLFLTVTMTISAISVLRFGSSGLAYLIDGLISPVIVAVLLKYAPKDTLIRLLQATFIFLFFNSILALLEMATQTHFMPYDIYSYFRYFRASAFLGHPLTNALVTAPMVILVLATDWPTWRRWLYALVYLSAIMGFGARAAFGVTILLLALHQAGQFSARLLKGRLRLTSAAIIPFALIAIVAIILTLLFQTNLGTRIVEMSTFNDTSAISRFKIGTLFNYVDSDQLLWGLDIAERNLILERNTYFSRIENFWVALILNFGIVLFIPFTIAFLRFLYGLGRGKGAIVAFGILTFVVVASANNSLSTKTPALMFLVVVCLGLGASLSDKKSATVSRAETA